MTSIDRGARRMLAAVVATTATLSLAFAGPRAAQAGQTTRPPRRRRRRR